MIVVTILVATTMVSVGVCESSFFLFNKAAGFHEM
jgi:hypothetical protein